MSKVLAAGGMALLLLSPGVAQAKLGGGHKGSGGGVCTQERFQRCLDKCEASGGPSKSSAVIKNCARRCGKKC